MPISSSAVSVDKKKTVHTQNKRNSQSDNTTKEKHFLTIGPALPLTEKKIFKSHSTLSTSIKKDDTLHMADSITLRTLKNGLLMSRTQKEKEKNPDRINLDRRGLTGFPVIEGEFKLRLLSLQHNLINNLDGLKEQTFPFLVFIDIYDNQLEKITCVDHLKNLRVLLIGKNRLKCIEGLQNLSKIEVLDLHGNHIQNVSGLSSLSELKVLNLAGNQLKSIGLKDLQGLSCLQELNLRRNRISKLLGFGETPNLQKLFLSNNEVQSLEDMSSVAKATKIKEISIDNNPVFLAGDCVSFLVSYLPQLHNLNSMQVTEHVRKAAMAWRRNKELNNSTFMDLANVVILNGRREEVISNARTNWELIRSQTKCLMTIKTNAVPLPLVAKVEPDADFVLTSLSKLEIKNVQSKTKPVPSSKTLVSCSKIGAGKNVSQGTDNTQNISSDLKDGNDYFRLPPILVPIINKLDNKNGNLSKDGVKLSGSLSSIGPNVDSSVSSLNSTHTDSSSQGSSSSSESDEESEVNKDENSNDEQGKLEDIPDENTKNFVHNSSDVASNLSTGTVKSNVTIPSTNSESSKNGSKASRNVKSAVHFRTVVSKVHSRAITAKPKKQTSPPLPTTTRDREQGGDYLIEICGRYLNIYGHGALRFMEKPWSQSKANDVHTINFNYANFNGITGILSKIKQRFPNAENFCFKETNIHCIGQLNALSEIQGMSSLFIGNEGNPIIHKNWQSYAIYRLSHWGLKRINGKEVTDDDIRMANTEYQSLSDIVLWSLPDVLLQPLLVRLHIDVTNSGTEQNAKKWLATADPALKNVVSKEALQWKKGVVPQEDLVYRQKAKHYCALLIDQTCDAINKLRQLEKSWPSILQETVQNTLLDYSQLDTYIKEKIQEMY